MTSQIDDDGFRNPRRGQGSPHQKLASEGPCAFVSCTTRRVKNTSDSIGPKTRNLSEFTVAVLSSLPGFIFNFGHQLFGKYKMTSSDHEMVNISEGNLTRIRSPFQTG